MNPIYLDSSEEDDGEEKEIKKTTNIINNGGINTTTRISVKKYLFDDVSKSPLAALTPKKLKPFNIQSKENSTYLNRLEHSYSPIKIDLDGIDALCQKTMENLENSIAKVNNERNTYTIATNKNFPLLLSENTSFKHCHTAPIDLDTTSDILSNKCDRKITGNTEKSKEENPVFSPSSMLDRTGDGLVNEGLQQILPQKPKVKVMFEKGLNEYLCDLAETTYFETNFQEVWSCCSYSAIFLNLSNVR